MLDGIRVLRFNPSGPSRATVMHIHGGAFRIGCPEAVGPFAAALAQRCSVTVVCPEYRLAPEHPFPAGLSDVLHLLDHLASGSGDPVIVSGDSAGGGLAASLAVLNADQGRRINGLALLSPWLDLTLSGHSYRANADTDPLFSLEAAREAADLYLHGQSPQHPLASPILASVAGFPPTFINAGSGEVVVDDAKAMAARLRDAGVPVTLQVVAEMDHVAVTRSLALPGAAEAFAALADFVDWVIEGES